MKYFLAVFVSLLICPVMSAAQEPAETGPQSSATQLTLDDLRTFTDVFNQLRSNFVHEVDDHTLLVAAIDGMISRLDPWSVFLDAERAQELDDASRGRYGGIGISVDMRDRRIYVESVYPDGPADRAGVKPGDIITAVEGRPVRGHSISVSLDALTGEPGSVVNVRFKTPDQPSRELSLEREYILVSSVSQEMLSDGIGYFQISHFHRNTHKELENSIASIRQAPGGPLSGIILDLRGNGGGVVLPAVEMADGFLDEGMIVYTQGRYEASLLEFHAKPGQWVEEVPVVILVDSKTASASEVFTGALQDHGRAVIIGQKTFGKGSIQSVFMLRNGSMLKLTTAHYFTPLGKTTHNNGIQPDIAVTPEETGELENDRLLNEALNHFSRIKES